MLRIVEDTYKEGTHDLQRGTCNALRWKELERRSPEVDGKVEKLPQTTIRPLNVAHVDLKGEMDRLVGGERLPGPLWLGES